MTTTVTISHNFETAHRLPHLGGKCVNLHGHSWKAYVTFTGTPDDDGVVADFGALKADLRGWIDGQLDHGTMLGAGDPLTPVLSEHGTKLFLFDDHGLTAGLRWPTVENVAELLFRVTTELLATGGRWQDHDLSVVRVVVAETGTNEAEVTP